MPVDHDYLDARLKSLRETIQSDIDLAFIRRDTKRYERQGNVMFGAMVLLAVVLWTIMLTLEFAT